MTSESKKIDPQIKLEYYYFCLCKHQVQVGQKKGVHGPPIYRTVVQYITVPWKRQGTK